MQPRHCPGFTFRKSIFIGTTDLGPKDVRAFMEKLAQQYSGNTYHLISKNCNHFCNDVCLKLTGKSIPRWVNRLARLGKEQIRLNCLCLLTNYLSSCLYALVFHSQAKKISMKRWQLLKKNFWLKIKGWSVVFMHFLASQHYNLSRSLSPLRVINFTSFFLHFYCKEHILESNSNISSGKN